VDDLLLEEDDTIEASGDEDTFSVDLVRGLDYEVTVFSEEGLDPLVEIFDEDGELLFSDDDSLLSPDPYLVFTVPSSGTYDIVVSDPDDGTGDYTVVLGESEPPLIA
jgi:hypothetical protein